MTKIEKVCIFYEDVFAASILWSNDGERLFIFTEDIRECDVIKEIKEAMKRPLCKAPDSEKVCTPGDFGPVEFELYREDGKEKLLLCRASDLGVYSDGMFPYLMYFPDAKIKGNEEDKKAWAVLDKYFALRASQEENS
ncbi:MAG: hypothetical protein LBT55_00520 [Clostridiaceae bacterium]|jgi:hypothetical protein|nr:hypothetical protein [Clostridiaceae bacterium]